MRGDNADDEPKGTKAQRLALKPVIVTDDLFNEIEEELDSVGDIQARARAMIRLDDAARVEQARYELSLDGPVDGPATRQLFDDLWRYAWPVIKAFLRTGRMHGVVQRYAPHRHGAIRPEDMVVLHASEDERDALAIDVISQTITGFRETAIIKGGWKDYPGGASIRTYFIGNCALNFPRAYAHWSVERTGRIEQIAVDHNVDLSEIADQIAALVPDPADVTTDRDELRRIIGKAHPQTKLILIFIAAGMTYAEIATELRLSVKAVDGRITRFRSKVRSQADIGISSFDDYHHDGGASR